MKRPSALRPLWAPLLLLGLLCVPALRWHDVIDALGGRVDESVRITRLALSTSLWLASAWLLNRLLEVLIWDGIIAPRLGGQVPKLLKDVVGALIFAIAVSSVLSSVFDLDITGLWATSGVLTFVLGLALQSMITDVASGIALNVDRPFDIGDWVEIHQRRGAFVGKVTESNWRSTRLQCIDGTSMIFPNGQIALYPIRNLTSPRLESRFDLSFHLDFSVPPERAMRVLFAGVSTAEGILSDPAPKVRIAGASKSGVEYHVLYWASPAEISPNHARHQVMLSVLRHLHKAGLTLAYEKQDIYHAAMPPRQLDSRRDAALLLGRLDIFSALSERECQELAERARLRDVKQRDEVVKVGQQGDSMFLLLEGALEVIIMEGVNEVVVGRLEPGDFFGEMSLLTGEPRSATVRAMTDAIAFEVRKEDLSPLLQGRPELAEKIASTVARRRVQSKRRKDAFARTLTGAESEVQSMSQQLLGKVRSLFLGG